MDWTWGYGDSYGGSSKVQELYSQAEKSGLGALDMAAVYHYLEKGDH